MRSDLLMYFCSCGETVVAGAGAGGGRVTVAGTGAGTGAETGAAEGFMAAVVMGSRGGNADGVGSDAKTWERGWRGHPRRAACM